LSSAIDLTKTKDLISKNLTLCRILRFDRRRLTGGIVRISLVFFRRRSRRISRGGCFRRFAAALIGFRPRRLLAFSGGLFLSLVAAGGRRFIFFRARFAGFRRFGLRFTAIFCRSIRLFFARRGGRRFLRRGGAFFLLRRGGFARFRRSGRPRMFRFELLFSALLLRLPALQPCFRRRCVRISD
jgi:hypothetical protein